LPISQNHRSFSRKFCNSPLLLVIIDNDGEFNYFLIIEKLPDLPQGI